MNLPKGNITVAELKEMIDLLERDILAGVFDTRGIIRLNIPMDLTSICIEGNIVLPPTTPAPALSDLCCGGTRSRNGCMYHDPDLQE